MIRNDQIPLTEEVLSLRKELSYLKKSYKRQQYAIKRENQLDADALLLIAEINHELIESNIAYLNDSIRDKITNILNNHPFFAG